MTGPGTGPRWREYLVASSVDQEHGAFNVPDAVNVREDVAEHGESEVEGHAIGRQKRALEDDTGARGSL
jgi:hypothetical protein